MARAPSDATLLRKARQELTTCREDLRRTSQERELYRGRAQKLDNEVVEWKARFDMLLKRTPEAL